MSYISQSDLENFEKKVTKEGDTQPEAYCRAAEEMIENFLGYSPEQKSYVSTIRADGGALLELEAWPVSTITALEKDGVAIDPTSVEVEKKCYICFKDNSVFSKGSKYTVSYTAGYETVPEVIRQVALQIAALFWESAGGNLAVSSTSYESSGTRVFNNFQADRFLKQIQMYKKAWG